MEGLTLGYDDRIGISSQWNTEADRTHWRELLGSFGNVKALHVDSWFIGPLSRALQPGEGESLMDLLPELQELSYSDYYNAFAEFIDARQKAGRPVTLTNK